jgi:hypothetical protein
MWKDKNLSNETLSDAVLCMALLIILMVAMFVFLGVVKQ